MADDSHDERLEPGRSPGDPLGPDEYRIGAVARLTGISTDTIRAWERRYNLISPTRTDSGLRVYSLDDIERLLLVKKLKDRGESVGDVARLPLEDLERRLDRAAVVLFIEPGLSR
ncbi:MAG: MerR family transcriptional regulator, partial [Acidobacteria bacterium]|nr:MerR family transcriptional regulator [Acidobacteriota bacterium]